MKRWLSFYAAACLLVGACSTATQVPPTSSATPAFFAIDGETATSPALIEDQKTGTKPTLEKSDETVPSNPSPEITLVPTPVSLNLTATPPPQSASVLEFPDPKGYIWQIAASGFNQPVDAATPKDDPGRLFVVEKEGQVRILDDGIVRSAPFLDLRKQVQTTGAYTRGLLGMTFHPEYARNGSFFVHYSGIGGQSVISSFTVSSDPNLADPESEVKLLEIDFPVGEHIGGGLAFGLDGYLYLSIGDGGGGGYGDKEGNAQNLNSLLGKLLRLDVDSGNPYAIPVDNPFADGSGKGEVWVYGLRNPWRFSFDSSTGDLFIADVGENQSEELDFIPAGSNGGVNFGWNYQEGTRRFQGSHPPDLELIPPIWEYDHSLGCAITGGVVYRGKALPEFNGVYLAADYCSGRIWGLLRNPDGSWKSQELFKIDAFITSFSQDDDGEVYAVDFTGEVLKLVRR